MLAGGRGMGAPKTQREAQLLTTVTALQRALSRAGKAAAGGVTNARYMQARPRLCCHAPRLTLAHMYTFQAGCHEPGSKHKG